MVSMATAVFPVCLSPMINSRCPPVELLLGISGIVEPLLVDDGVDGNSGFPGLSVTDDQFSLSSANGHQRVHSLDSSLHGLRHGLSGNDSWCLQANSVFARSANGSLVVDRNT